jgi:hypothetical protein
MDPTAALGPHIPFEVVWPAGGFVPEP